MTRSFGTWRSWRSWVRSDRNESAPKRRRSGRAAESLSAPHGRTKGAYARSVVVRRLTWLIAFAVVWMGAVFLASRPFSFDASIDGRLVRVHSRAPIVAAWASTHRDPVGVWAVTDGDTGRSRFEARSGGGSYAVGRARVRLAGAVTLAALTAVMAPLLGRGRRPRIRPGTAGAR